jgi:hypothetical protein
MQILKETIINTGTKNPNLLTTNIPDEILSTNNLRQVVLMKWSERANLMLSN